VTDLILRDVEVAGVTGLDIAIAGGIIRAIGRRLDGKATQEIDGAGGALLPGLIDHHIHLLALAAELDSIVLAPERSWVACLQDADRRLPSGRWLRATGYHESFMGALDRHRLDAVIPGRPVRVQHSTGALWVLNSEALERVGANEHSPAGVERAGAGAPTGKVFREDAWLRRTLRADYPSLAQVAALLDGYGITGVTDASVTNDQAAAALLAERGPRDGLRQRVYLMTGDPEAPVSTTPLLGAGPMKIMLDDEGLGDPAVMATKIRDARAHRRRVAVHCVTTAQLAYALAAFAEAGTLAGDRIEHGSLIDDAMADGIAKLGLTVVSQPAFVAQRGDRYLAEVDPAEHGHLYRLAGLKAHDVALAGSSDAPYGPADPWAGMRAAVTRRTVSGAVLAGDERLNPREALDLYLGHFANPGSRPRRIEVGEPADLCLMSAPLRIVLGELRSELVRATIVAGRPSMSPSPPRTTA
jgi:predicted amidohydrolase YtcJ